MSVCILINKFNITGVCLFLRKSTFTGDTDKEDRGLNKDRKLVDPLRSRTLKIY